MRKNRLIVILAAVCVLTLAATLFAGCKGASLSTPEGFQYANDKFSWNAVEGADGYKVFVNDALNEFYVTETSVEVGNENIKSNLKNQQENVLYVKAVTLDEEGNVKDQSEVAQFAFDYAVTPQSDWTVTFDLNYASAPEAQNLKVKGGEKFDKPANPQRTGYTFNGWFRDKQGKVAAEFDANGKSSFDVTANLTLYASWTENEPIEMTAVYFYSESWTEIKVQPSKGETKLYDGDGIAMTAVSGKANWFKADIDASATSVIFTNGTDSTESAAFDKSKPYCKDGAWTAEMPGTDPGPTPSTGVVVVINGDTANAVKLEKNATPDDPNVTQEYHGTLTLKAGDTVKIMEGEFEYSNFEAGCAFNGTATVAGDYTFYAKKYQDGGDSVWVTVPSTTPDPTPSTGVVIIINGDTANAVKLEKNATPDDPNVTQEYHGTLTLKAGDTVKIMEGEFEYVNYEPGCKFDGTATVAGDYTFYAKKYQDGGDSIWVTVPSGGDPTPDPDPNPETVKIYLYIDPTWADDWSAPTAYCWNDSGNNTWPGVAMTALGNGWFTVDVSASYTKIIFAGKPGHQTANLDLVAVNGVAYYNYYGITEDRPAE